MMIQCTAAMIRDPDLAERDECNELQQGLWAAVAATNTSPARSWWLKFGSLFTALKAADEQWAASLGTDTSLRSRWRELRAVCLEVGWGWSFLQVTCLEPAKLARSWACQREATLLFLGPLLRNPFEEPLHSGCRY